MSRFGMKWMMRGGAPEIIAEALKLCGNYPFVIEVDSTITDGSSSPSNQYQTSTDPNGVYNIERIVVKSSTDTLYTYDYSDNPITDWDDSRLLIEFTEPGVNEIYYFSTIFKEWDINTTSVLSGYLDRNKITNYLRFGDVFEYGVETNLLDGSSTLVNITPIDVPKVISQTSFNVGFAGSQPNPKPFESFDKLGDWDTSTVLSMLGAFEYQREFDENISGWNLSNVTTLNFMFRFCESFDNKGSNAINLWNVSSVDSFIATFQFCNIFNRYINDWDVSSGTHFNEMFRSCLLYNQNVGNWDMTSALSVTGMFEKATMFNNGGSPDIDNWRLPVCTDFSEMFFDCSAFNQPINNWDVSSGVTFFRMFRNANSFNQNVGAWDVSSGTNFNDMFRSANNFNNGGSPDINNWDVSRGTSFSTMFGQSPFNQPIGNWTFRTDITSISLQSMFLLTTAFNQDLGNWNVSGVNSMVSMFQDAVAYNNGDIAGASNDGLLGINQWNTFNVSTMISTFRGAISFNQNIKDWNVINVNSMSNMFRDATSFNQPILAAGTNWDTSGVMSFASFLRDATSFSQDLDQIDITSIPDNSNAFITAFDNIAISPTQYDALLDSLYTQVVANGGTQVNITFGALGVQYTSANQDSVGQSRYELINTYGWIVTDGGGI